MSILDAHEQPGYRPCIEGVRVGIHRGLRLSAVLLGLGSVLLLGAPIASAATVHYVPSTGAPTASIRYEADPGEVNQLRVTPLAPIGPVNGVLLSDPGATHVTAGSGSGVICPLASPAATLCHSGVGLVSLTPIGRVHVGLGDRDDTLRVDESLASLGISVNPGVGDDSITTGRSNDVFTHAPGSDDFRGGGGIDQAAYHPAPAGVTVSLDDIADDGPPQEGDNIHSDVESVGGSEFADLLIGSDADNKLAGSRGADRLEGAGGDDELSGAEGDDRLDGGDGADALSGGIGNDLLVGGPGSDLVRGGAGDDVIRVRDGEPDQVRCDAGADSVEADPLDEIASDCESVDIGPSV